MKAGAAAPWNNRRIIMAKQIQISFTPKELELLDFVIGNGYGDGNIYQEGYIDTKVQQAKFERAWGKIQNARFKKRK